MGVATVTGGGAGGGGCFDSLQAVAKVQRAKAIHQACGHSFGAEDFMLISDAFIYSLPMDQKIFKQSARPRKPTIARTRFSVSLSFGSGDALGSRTIARQSIRALAAAPEAET